MWNSPPRSLALGSVMRDLDAALADFEADLDRLDQLLNLIKTFRVFAGSSVPQAIADQTVPWPEARNLLSAASGVRTDLPIVSASLQLYLAGRFEYFVRETVELVAAEIASKATQFAALPEQLRTELRAKTLDIAQDPRRYRYDEIAADALLESYVSAKRAAAGSMSISTEVLAITEVNMKERVLADVLKRVGIKDLWRDVGKQADMKLLLNTQTDQETTTAAQNKLNELMDERNQVAHPTANTTFPDPDKVLASVAFVRGLAQICKSLARIHLRTYAGATGSNGVAASAFAAAPTTTGGTPG